MTMGYALRIAAGFAVALGAAAAAADEQSYALGLGVSADNGDGFSATTIADFAFNERASVSASYASTTADALPEDITTRDWFVGARYDFGPLGVEASGGQSGDPDDFDSTDLTVGVFHAGEHWNLSARYLERDVDLVVRPFLRNDAIEVEVPLKAEGWRLAARYRSEDGLSVGASLREYDYDRDLSPLSGNVIVRRLSPTTLTLSSALTDRTVGIDAEFPIGGSRALGFGYTRDTLAGGLGEVDSVTANLLLPVGSRGDLDIGVGLSRGDDLFADDTVFVSVLYLFYGILD